MGTWELGNLGILELWNFETWGQKNINKTIPQKPLGGGGGGRGDGGGEGLKKMLKSFLAAVLLSASVERFFVSRMRDFSPKVSEVECLY